MFTRLVFVVMALGTAMFSGVGAVSIIDSKQSSQKRPLRNLLTKLTKRKLEIRGELVSEGMSPVSGALVFADASRCSLVLPVNAAASRDVCEDVRVVGETDSKGQYLLKMYLGREQKYLHVRFKIGQDDASSVIIPLASVDHMLGEMKAGSYYRLDKERQRDLVTKWRSLVYASRKVPLTPEQLGDREYVVRQMLSAKGFLNVFNYTAPGQVIGATATCAEDMWQNSASLENTSAQLVDLRFLIPKKSLKNITSTQGFPCNSADDVPDNERIL